jgi:hypothetical protein
MSLLKTAGCKRRKKSRILSCNAWQPACSITCKYTYMAVRTGRAVVHFRREGRFELAWIAPGTLAVDQAAGRQTDTDTQPPAERTFAELDGGLLSRFAHRWRIMVYSVTDHDGWRWIQLALKGQPEYTLTVKTAASAPTAAILQALSSWVAKPRPSERVLSVA